MKHACPSRLLVAVKARMSGALLYLKCGRYVVRRNFYILESIRHSFQ